MDTTGNTLGAVFLTNERCTLGAATPAALFWLSVIVTAPSGAANEMVVLHIWFKHGVLAFALPLITTFEPDCEQLPLTSVVAPIVAPAAGRKIVNDGVLVSLLKYCIT